MIEYRYARGAVLMRLLPLQLIPTILITMWIGAATGATWIRSPETFPVIAIAGLALYGIVMAFLVNVLRRPLLLRITERGAGSWRAAFAYRSFQTRPGATVAYDDREVRIRPAVARLPGFREENGETVITLPQGLQPVTAGSFVVARP